MENGILDACTSVRLLRKGRFELICHFIITKIPGLSVDVGRSKPPMFLPSLSTCWEVAARSNEPLEKRHHNVAVDAGNVRRGIFPFLTAVQKDSGLANLALAGGCAMNFGRQRKGGGEPSFSAFTLSSWRRWLGGANWSALAATQQVGGKRSLSHGISVFGRQFSEEGNRRVIGEKRKSIRVAGCAVNSRDESELYRVLLRGCRWKVVGWFQGRMEWGQGSRNRSILGDPRRADMKQSSMKDQKARVLRLLRFHLGGGRWRLV